MCRGADRSTDDCASRRSGSRREAGRLISAGSVRLSGLAGVGECGIGNPEIHAAKADEGDDERSDAGPSTPRTRLSDVKAAGAEIGVTFAGLNHRDNRLANGGNQFSMRAARPGALRRPEPCARGCQHGPAGLRQGRQPGNARRSRTTSSSTTRRRSIAPRSVRRVHHRSGLPLRRRHRPFLHGRADARSGSDATVSSPARTASTSPSARPTIRRATGALQAAGPERRH